jgi:hypothetical protein
MISEINSTEQSDLTSLILYGFWDNLKWTVRFN